MTTAGAATNTMDVLVFQRGDHRFAIDAAVVSFVHQRAPDEDQVPIVEMSALTGEGQSQHEDRTLRVVAGDNVFDLRAGSQLRVVGVRGSSFAEIPLWLAGIATRMALRGVSLNADGVIWLLDEHALARRAGKGSR